MKWFLAVAIITSSAESFACQFTSEQQLSSYITNFASTFTPYTGRGSSTASSEAANNLLNTYSSCENIINLRGMGKCFERARSAASVIQKRTSASGNTMQFEIPDREYLNSVTDEAKSLPPELRDGLPANYRELARQKGWKVFQYRSQTVPNPPNGSFNRVLILAEGNPYDKWIQFTTGDYPNLERPERLVDFISIDKSANPKKIFFNQFWRNENGRAPQPRIDAHGGGGLDTCISCHPNGMRSLSPAPGSYSREDSPMLAAMNNKMDSYGRIDWGKGYTPDGYGPTLGMEQGCMTCHNGGSSPTSRGIIHPMTAQGHIQHKMLQDLTMPPTWSRSREEALTYLKNVPNLLDEETRKRLNSDVYSRQPDDNNQAVLDWLKQQNRLSEADHQKYTQALADMREENRPLFSSLSRPGREDYRQWLLESCDLPGENSAVVNSSDRSVVEEGPSRSSPQSGESGNASAR